MKHAVFLIAALSVSATAQAADISAPLPAPALPVPPSWTFRLTPYAWLPALTGKTTVKGRTTDIDASFTDVIKSTFDNGGTLAALMLDGEARNGPFSVFGDAIWDRVTLSPSSVKSKTLESGITGTLGTSLNAKSTSAILEAGAGYEFAQLGPVAFDVIAGARYWYQRVELDLALFPTLDIGDLIIRGNRAIGRSGSVDWLDGFVGARARWALAPGQEIVLRGDVGGGGSNVSWQAIAAYSYDFATRNGVTYSGVLGYKALYVDYEQGEGRTKYRFDMLQHGPVIGLNIRF
jgi:hypothetical protein